MAAEFLNDRDNMADLDKMYMVAFPRSLHKNQPQGNRLCFLTYKTVA